jgi:hypothetical protein
MASQKISQLTQVTNPAETLSSELAGYFSGVNYRIPVSDFFNSCALENMAGQLDLSTRVSTILPISSGGTNVTTSADVLPSLFGSTPNSTVAVDATGAVVSDADRRFLYIPFLNASFDNYYNNLVILPAGAWDIYTAFTQDSPPGSMGSTKTHIDSQLLFPSEATFMTQAYFTIVCQVTANFDFRVVIKNQSGTIVNTIVPSTSVTVISGVSEYNIVTPLTWPAGFPTTPSLEFEIRMPSGGAIVMYEVSMVALSRPL